MPGFRDRFVQVTDAHQMVSVISLVKPWDRTKFITHLLLSLGKYDTETDVFCRGSLKDAFVYVGLLQSSSNISESAILTILKSYIIKDLRFHPISSRQFAKYVKAAFHTLTDVLVGGVLSDYTPCLTDVMLKDQASDELKSKEAVRKSNLISALYDDDAVRPSLPELPEMLEAATLNEPLQWTPIIQPVDGVDAAAVAEQTAALQCCVNAVDKFLTPGCCGVKFPCLVGRAGSGKTHVLKMAVTYALSKGLTVELMSWTSERARKLGGNHLHLVFPIEVNKSRIAFSHAIAGQCLAQLNRSPMKKALIMRTDVFAWEELGLLSAEMFAALDNILRVLMGNNLPLGGKLWISTGDSKQLAPIDGRPIFGSVNMCTMMDVFVFTTDVRAHDRCLRWLNSECRRPLDESECKTVAETIFQSECQFVPTWHDVPECAVRIVSTKAAERDVMKQFLRGRETVSFTAVDEVQNGSVWEEAGDRVTKRLNGSVYEYDVCKLYLNAIVRLTYNNRQGSPFSQGQIAVIIGLPDDSVDFADQRLRLRLAPPGVRTIDTANIPADWPEVSVGPRTTPAVPVGKYLQMGRRTQFPVRYYQSSTVHRIQGDTVALVATELSLSRRDFRLWDRAQFAVIISRVRSCSDLIFVGNVDETRAAIEHIMSKTSKWDNLIDHFMSELNTAVQPARARQISLDSHPFLPLYRELPSAPCGYVYLLASLSVTGHCFIGETTELKRCLRQHNTGYGAEETMNTSLHPWGVFAFVIGFDQYSVEVSADQLTDLAEYGHELRRQSASEWSSRICPDLSIDDLFAAGQEIANEFQ